MRNGMSLSKPTFSASSDLSIRTALHSRDYDEWLTVFLLTGLLYTQIIWQLHGQYSGIATSHDLTHQGSWKREIPLFHGNLGWWNMISSGQPCATKAPKSYRNWLCTVEVIYILLINQHPSEKKKTNTKHKENWPPKRHDFRSLFSP